MKMRKTFFAVLVLLFAGTARAQYNQVIATPHSDYKLENDIPYREAAECYAQ